MRPEDLAAPAGYRFISYVTNLIKVGVNEGCSIHRLLRRVAFDQGCCVYHELQCGVKQWNTLPTKSHLCVEWLKIDHPQQSKTPSPNLMATTN